MIHAASFSLYLIRFVYLDQGVAQGGAVGSLNSDCVGLPVDDFRCVLHYAAAIAVFVLADLFRWCAKAR